MSLQPNPFNLKVCQEASQLIKLVVESCRDAERIEEAKVDWNGGQHSLQAFLAKARLTSIPDGYTELDYGLFPFDIMGLVPQAFERELFGIYGLNETSAKDGLQRFNLYTWRCTPEAWSAYLYGFRQVSRVIEDSGFYLKNPNLALSIADIANNENLGLCRTMDHIKASRDRIAVIESAYETFPPQPGLLRRVFTRKGGEDFAKRNQLLAGFFADLMPEVHGLEMELEKLGYEYRSRYMEMF